MRNKQTKRGIFMSVTVTINAKPHEVADEHLEMSLLRYLREVLGLTGAKCGCDRGQCGSCNVLIDGECRRSCLFKMKKLDGKDILTVEGLADGDKLHPIQESFIVEGVMQCGFCTPGQIMAVAGLLRKTLTPTREEIDKAFKGVLCRCGSYPRVIKAIHRAAAIMRGDEWTDEKRVFDDVIGSSYPMVDAVGKVTGSLKYVDDYYVPGMLCGKVVWSEEPSAQLLGIDASEALAVPGVVRVITHADCPDLYYGPLTMDAPVLCGGRIRSRAEPLALVLAETQEIANAAAKLVKIDYEILPAVFSPHEALAPGAPSVTTDYAKPGIPIAGHSAPESDGNVTLKLHLGKGDVEKAFAEAAVIIDEEYSSQRIEHGYIEPECSITVPLENGRYVNYSNSQAAFGARDNCARALECDPEKVNFCQIQVGGSFGGKGDHLLRMLSCVGTRVTGRAVRVTLSREDSLRYHNKRHPFEMHEKLAVAADGRILGLQNYLLGDGGAYTYFSTRIMPQGRLLQQRPLRHPELRFDRCCGVHEQRLLRRDARLRLAAVPVRRGKRHRRGLPQAQHGSVRVPPSQRTLSRRGVRRRPARRRRSRLYRHARRGGKAREGGPSSHEGGRPDDRHRRGVRVAAHVRWSRPGRGLERRSGFSGRRHIPPAHLRGRNG